MSIYQKTKSLGFVRIANVVLAAAVAVGLAYGALALADAGNLAITCDNVSINGNVWTMSGTWHAYDFPGQASDYDAAIFSPSGTIADGSSKDAPDTFAATSSGEFYGNEHNPDMAGTWSNQVTFNTPPTGIFATLAHSQITGNESSGDAFCSFVIPPGHIVVDKVTSPAQDPQSFTFTTTGAGYNGFSLTDTDTPNNQSLPAGTYSVAETAVTNWTSDGGVCDGGQTPGSINLGSGQTVHCTFTNTYTPLVVPAHLTLVKNLIKDDLGTAAATDWTLSATGGPTPISGVSGNAAVTNAAVNPGTYTLSESAGPSGYVPSQYSCVKNNGAPVSGNSITLVSNDTATCTITNDDVEPGVLIVRKTVINNNGTASSSADDFSFQVNGGSVTAFEVDGENQISVLAGGTYTVIEVGTPITGYSTSYSNCSELTIASGTTTTCTITNDDIPRNMGTITVNKVVTGSSSALTFFDFIASWDQDGFSLKHGESEGPVEVSVSGSPYSVSETVEPGWAQSATCVNQSQTVFATSSITIADGDSVTCTFTNTQLPQCSNGLDDDQDGFTDFGGEFPDPGCDSSEDNSEDALGSITIYKDVNDDTKMSEVFTFDVTGSTTDSFGVSEASGGHVLGSLLAGHYIINEQQLGGGWTLATAAVTCNEGSTVSHDQGESDIDITLGEGENVTCTYHNQYDAPPGERQTEHIKIEKQVTAGSDEQDTFTFNVNWDEVIPALADNQSHTSIDLNEDQSYSVVENVPDGWEQTGVTCTGVVPGQGDEADTVINDIDSDNIVLQDGETVTCVFTNDETGDNGGGGGSHHRSGGGSSGGGEVLGAQTTVIPAGAPNTGFGGMSGMAGETANALAGIFTLLGSAALVVGKKKSYIED